ncbi:MAG: AMP-binding protein, partial [Bacteriovorax sp.]|nr:AMP-binding protein [Bacteriovorax sp.]
MDTYSILPDELHEYWTGIANTFQWRKKWDSLQTGNFNEVNVQWFMGARLNITENCLDRHLEKRRQKKALIFEPNNPDEAAIFYTYGELHISVCRFANLLKKKGVKKGDIVCFYMGMTPEVMIGILACARIGAIHTVVFGGFSPQSLRGRLEDSKAKIIITHDGSFRGDKITPLKNMVDEAIENLTTVETVLVVKRTHSEIQMKPGRDYFYDVLIKDCEPYCPAVEVEAEDPLFILYTSGSTGKPKGLVHTNAGYMVHVGNSFKDVFQIKENDIFWCTADIGWITGHSYLTYGPLLNGTTTVMFEGTPNYPTPARFWEVIEKHHISHLYTAPTAIRSLEKFGNDIPESFSMKSLKVLGSVGEPINEEAWQWYHKYVGKDRCPIVDTWWQTETGGIMISP